eukprot:SAG31_NODE_796_length_12032_cov_21.073242_5_plen_77_part_00
MTDEVLPPLGLHQLCKRVILEDMVDIATGGIDGTSNANKVLVTDAMARTILNKTVGRAELTLVRRMIMIRATIFAL